MFVNISELSLTKNKYHHVSVLMGQKERYFFVGNVRVLWIRLTVY